MYAHSIQEGVNKCQNLSSTDCTHLCIGTPLNKYSCLCPDDMKYSSGKCVCPDGNNAFENGTCPKGMELILSYALLYNYFHIIIDS